MEENQFNWDIPISYAPNTMQVPIGNTIIVRNVDGEGSVFYVQDVDMSKQEPAVRERILAILN